MKAKMRIFNALAAATIFLICVVGAIVGWSSFIQEPYLYYQNLPFPAMQQVAAGDAVQLNVERCNRSDRTRTYLTTHALKNATTGVSELLPDVQVSIEPGCIRGISKINVIPLKTPPGKYSVWGVALIDMGISTRQIPWYSETFEVVPAKEVVVILGVPAIPNLTKEAKK